MAANKKRRQKCRLFLCVYYITNAHKNQLNTIFIYIFATYGKIVGWCKRKIRGGTRGNPGAGCRT